MATLTADTFARETSYLKAGLRFGVGSFDQIYRGQSSEESYFFPDISLLYFSHPRIAIGGGFEGHRIAKYNILDFWAWRLSGRFYLRGYGVPRVVVTDNFEAYNWSRWGFYVSGDFRRYHYSLPIDPRISNTIPSDGNFSQVCAGAGAEYRITPNFDINFEITGSIYSYGESDIQIRPYTIFALIGLGYAW
jgi:hypothetical protein